MDFDLQWFLVGLPVVFALGWLASRMDLQQFRRDSREAPKAYFTGLNLLLNEQQDKAIDAFIEAVQHDPDTTELHFALGNLFRRRGEFERAVRVHQHLMQRADLKASDRDRAQHALAQDFMKAGLFDRAEEAWRALRGTGFDADAQTALLSLYERSRDWQRAVDVANTLETRRTQALPTIGNGNGSGNDHSTGQAKPPGAGGWALTGSLASRIAHYHCELAEEADKQGRGADAQSHLQFALAAAPDAPRAHVLAGKRLAAAGRHAEALRAWDLLRQQHPAAFLLVAQAYAQAAVACGQVEAARASLSEQLERFPGNSLLEALAQLDKAGGQPESLSLQRWLTQLTQRPSLSAAAALLAQPRALWPEGSLAQVQRAVALAAKPLQRYRCAACGFEAQHYFWQCPGCLNWDSYPTQHIEEL